MSAIPLVRLFRDADKYYAIDQSDRVFIGKPGHMQEAEVKNIRRMLNDDSEATQYFSLKEGTLFVPPRSEIRLSATFNERPLMEFDPGDARLVNALKIKNVKPLFS